MTQTISPNPQAMLAQLLQLKTASPPAPPTTIETARQWVDAITNKLDFLENDAHPIVFIGSVGVGKSSLIGVAASLLVGPAPTDRTSLKNNSVLAIGSGRTTVCEVRIRASENASKVGLVVEPFSVEEMEKEIRIYAEDEWHRQQPNTRRTDEDDSDPTSQEVQRVIRGMTDYVEYQESYIEGRIRRRRNVRPLDNVVPIFGSSLAFANHMLERANLPSRTTTEWWWDAPTAENLKYLKSRFEAVNQGMEQTVMLPRRMTVVVPEPLPGSRTDLNLTLIDTRGLDGTVESRRDLQDLLRNPRAVIVLCAPFKDAPGDTLRILLRSMAGDAELRQAIPRTLLVLLDHGDADQVNGAGGDREFGQELKIDECYVALDGTGLPRMIDKSQIIAFDALKDDRNYLLTAIEDRLSSLRLAIRKELNEQVEAAHTFLESSADLLRPALRDTVDQKLRETLAQHVPIGTPLVDPLAGLYEAVRASRYASVVYATCRRRGAYSRLDLYAAVAAEASRAATVWLDGLMNAISDKLNELEGEASLRIVWDHIRLRRTQYQDTQLKVIRSYAENVGRQVEEVLKLDPVWEVCRSEWGAGGGFKDKVLGHLESWSRRQLNFTAHESTDAAKEIPLLGEVSRPAQAPRFTLYVCNLRGLRQVKWSPEPLSIVIGANGAGKTTLLQTLRLLRVAYERGLPDAVTIVLGGSSNLRHWGITEEEPVEIGLDIGEASWRIQLMLREGSVDYLTSERLTDRNREIFSRDSLGTFLYGSERIEPSSLLGLRVLMERGVHEPAIRAMAAFLQRISVYHDPDLWSLRTQGSSTSEDRLLHARGGNALAVLRRWHQDRTNRHRYQFVLEGLTAAFPNTVKDMDFVEAGSTLAARIYAPDSEFPSQLASEANGVLQLLVLFCDLASAEDESVVAIDEPENSLHPYALRAFLRRATQWARQHKLTVLLATHSTVLLDELSAYPEQVYVMKAPQPGEPSPTRLDDLYDRKWMEGFKLGDLYEQGEIGSNEDGC
jgi:predicted ATPase